MSHVETLEARKLLSGDVTAALDADALTLRITGDAQSNQIVVSTDINGTTVTPLQDTTVNGGIAPVLFPYADIVMIDTANGNDHVGLSQLDLQDCFVSTGNGSDTVFAEDNLFFKLNIDTGAGGDHVTFAGTNGVGSGIAIDLGTGKDVLTISGDLWVKGNGIGDPIDGGNGFDVLDRSGFTGTFPGVDLIDIDSTIA